MKNSHSEKAVTMGNKDKKLRVPPEQPYLTGANLDYLARINMELFTELWITRDRLAVVEELLNKKGILDLGEVDSFVPDDEFNERMEILRSVVTANVIGAPFKHQCTVESLVAEGKKLALLNDLARKNEE